MQNSVKCPYCGVDHSMQDVVDFYYSDRNLAYPYLSWMGTRECVSCKKEFDVEESEDFQIDDPFLFTAEKIQK